ncbi:MAG TPA: aldose epimerase family protein [Polyangiaceae bacterium]|jgi:aldose 1-epimerase
MPSRAEVGSIEAAKFGSVGGRDVSLFTLSNRRGSVLKITNYGATVTELHVPDRSGKLADVVLGLDTLEQYVASKAYFGGIVGRVANRIRNGRFELEGKSHSLAQNDGANHLHGGVHAFNQVVWTAKPSLLAEAPALELAYLSTDGEEGYPNELDVHVTYQLTHEDEFCVEMSAEARGVTIVNLAHHSYFNLAGHDSGSTLDHELLLRSNAFSIGDVDPERIEQTAGTPLDFSRYKSIGRDLAELGSAQGYDHNFVLLGAPGELREAARVRDPKSGRTLVLETDQPGLQFYCGSFLDGSEGGKGARYERHAGFCLESQKFPYAINVPAWREQVILRPGEVYRHRMVHRFSSAR